MKMRAERWRRFRGAALRPPSRIIPQSQLYPVHDPPPVVLLNAPTNNSTYTAAASVTIGANAPRSTTLWTHVNFYGGPDPGWQREQHPHTITATGLAAGSYGFGKRWPWMDPGSADTSAPVNITVMPALASLTV